MLSLIFGFSIYGLIAGTSAPTTLTVMALITGAALGVLLAVPFLSKLREVQHEIETEERGYWQWAADGDYDMLTVARLNALEAYKRWAEECPFAIKLTGEVQSLCWKGDYDSVYVEAIRPALVKWLAAYPQVQE